MENEIKDKNEIKANLRYLKSEIKDYQLPVYYNEFLTQIHEIFPEDKQLFIAYNYEKQVDENIVEKIIEVKNSEDYDLMISRLQKNQLTNREVLIETDEIPAGTGRKYPKNFDENIECIVERELKVAAENIKEALIGKKNNYNEFKKHEEKCCQCKNEIVGNLYKDVLEEDKYYCEKCSDGAENPTFILH